MSFINREEARRRAHFHFDKLWKLEYMTRTEAYDWLSKIMDKSESKAHIRYMDKKECEQIVSYAMILLSKLKRKIV